jgi:DNA-binding transcriptional ArsR family regulator
MDQAAKRVDDLATLRAIAHPLRMRLLGALRIDGPATASQLGRRFDESSGATSYHLRQLARYGFVEEDADQPTRRERRWRATSDYTSWNSADFLDDVGGQAALRVFERQRIDYTVRHLQRWYAERQQWSRGWSAAEIDSDWMLRLRAEDLNAMKQELDALLARYRAAERDQDDADAARVLVLAYAFPVTEVEL